MSRETRFEWKIDAMAVMLTRHHLLQSTTILRSTRCRKGGVRTKDLPFPYILLPHTPTSSILHPTKHLILQNRVSSPPPHPKPPPPIRQTYKEGGGGTFSYQIWRYSDPNDRRIVDARAAYSDPTGGYCSRRVCGLAYEVHSSDISHATPRTPSSLLTPLRIWDRR